MSGYDLYVFILCLIVFVILVGLSSTMLTIIIKSNVKLIRLGDEDDDIKAQFNSTKKRKGCKGVDFILSLLLCVILCVCFAFSLFVGAKEESFSNSVPTFRVVKSGSMSKKHEKNVYLVANNLNDQIQTFDLILTYKAPTQDELKIYDIIVYETDGKYIVHRIINIEEPNERHPDERWFLCQGDANDVADRFPVKYSQIKGVYRGQKIPFAGSFVIFMQSPAGWLCIMLVIAAIIITPLIDKKFQKERYARYLILCPQTVVDNDTVAESDDLTSTEQEFEELNEEVIESVNERVSIRKTFYQKLESSSDIVKERYNRIREFLCRIKGVRVIESKMQHTYKCKSVPVARLTFRGKTLNVLLGLNVDEYTDSKYIFTDLSSSKKHVRYPMRVKLSSERQTRWTIELINDIVSKNNLTLLERPADVKVIVPHGVVKRKKGRDFRSFDQIINSLPIAKERYNIVKAAIAASSDVRLIEGRRQKTYKLGNTPIARFVVRGNILNVYFNSIAEKYVDHHYIYKDVSSVLSHTNYPIRVPLTSEVQTEWAVELVHKIYFELGVLLGADNEN